MQIVIDIPEEVWAIIERSGNVEWCGIEMADAIENGIPLPKGHGRLIDANALLMDFAFANNKSAGECVNDAPTVIDKESEE